MESTQKNEYYWEGRCNICNKVLLISKKRYEEYTLAVKNMFIPTSDLNKDTFYEYMVPECKCGGYIEKFNIVRK